MKTDEELQSKENIEYLKKLLDWSDQKQVNADTGNFLSETWIRGQRRTNKKRATIINLQLNPRHNHFLFTQ